MNDSRRLVDKLWAYCDVLRDDGVGVIEYTEQLTYLLFLKMAHERATRKLAAERIIPDEYSSGTIRSGAILRVARSCAILRNSRYVSCSVYSMTPTPSSRSTSQYAHSLFTKRRESFTGEVCQVSHPVKTSLTPRALLSFRYYSCYTCCRLRKRRAELGEGEQHPWPQQSALAISTPLSWIRLLLWQHPYRKGRRWR